MSRKDEKHHDAAAQQADAAAESTEAGGEDELTKLRRERDELFDRVARLQADFQNSRRRLEADAEQRLQYANSNLIKALIPVIDNFERALAVDPAKTDAAAVLKGLQLVHDQWLTVLKKEQVETIAPQPGEDFDPARHEALMHEPTDEHPPETITRFLTKGYALRGRTLRPASVAVAKAK